MRNLFRLILLLACFVSGTCSAQNQSAPGLPTSPVTQPAEKQHSTEEMLSNCKSAYDRLQSENDFLKSKGYAAQEGYNEYFYGDYARKAAEVQLNTYIWQARASEILIWVVVIVCLSGVLFSGYQLCKATAPAPVGGSVDKSNADPLATNVELSWQNVRMTSSVIGLVVLVISVAYLYLFLKEVYRIDMIGQAVTALETAQGSLPKEKIDPDTAQK